MGKRQSFEIDKRPSLADRGARGNPSIIDSIISGIEESKIAKILAESFRSWHTNWPLLLLSMLVDFLFLISVGTIVTLIQFALFDHLEALMTLAGDATGGIINIYNQTETVGTGLMGLSNSPEFQSHLTSIFKYLGLLIAAVFVLWVIFQGISWYLSQRMSASRPRPFLVFWKNFALASFPFFFLTVLWIFLSVRLLFAIKMSLTPFMGEDLLNFLFVLFVLVTWYFGSLCYTMDGNYAYQNFKGCFTYGIRRFSKVIQSFAAIAVLFLLIDIILKIGFIRADPVILMIVGTVLFMPALVFARIVLFKTREEYWPESPHHK